MRMRSCRGKSRNDESDTSSSSETSYINKNKSERKRRSRSTTKTRHSSKNNRRQRNGSRCKSSSSSSKSTIGSNKASERGSRCSSTASSSSNCSNTSRGSQKRSGRVRRRSGSNSGSTPETRKYREEFRNVCGKGPSENKYSERNGNNGKRSCKSGDRQRSTNRSLSRTRDNGGRPSHSREKKHGLDRGLSPTKRGKNGIGRSYSSSPERRGVMKTGKCSSHDRYKRSPSPSRNMNRSSGSSENTYRSSKNTVRSPGSSRNKVRSPGSTRNKDRSPGSSRNEYWSPDSSRNQDRTPGSSRNKYWSPGSSRNKDRSPGSSRNEYWSPDSSRNKDRSPGSSRNKDRTPGSSRNKYWSPGSSRNKDRSPGWSGNKYSYKDQARERSQWRSSSSLEDEYLRIGDSLFNTLRKKQEKYLNSHRSTLDDRSEIGEEILKLHPGLSRYEPSQGEDIRLFPKQFANITPINAHVFPQTVPMNPASVSFEWQFQDEHGSWISYGKPNSAGTVAHITTTSSDYIEKHYVSNSVNPTPLTISSRNNAQYFLDLKNLTQTNLQSGVKKKIRRVLKDSPSYTITPKGSSYVWSFKDDDGNWIKYGETSSSNEATSATTTSSDDIETKYAWNPTASLEIASGHHKYIIDFNTRTQTNINTKAVRAIQRQLVTPSDLPSNWTTMNPSEMGLRVVPLSSTDKESIKQVSFVKRTLPSNFTITKVFRIQNEHLWMDFVNGKERLEKRNPQINYKEVYLFHGTDPKHVQAICAENLDFRLSGTNGTSYGQGTYFATSAAYSANYAGSGPTKLMFIVKVLIGHYTVGNSSLRRPPQDESGVFYDATVDNQANPTIYVKYVNTEYYPEYYIEFT